MQLSEDFTSNLQQYDLINLEKEILVAISGGLDSMVLAHLFIENKIPIALCHINFNLRGEESDQDMDFITEFARTRGLKLFTRSIVTLRFSKKAKCSIQMAARELRYSSFEEICNDHGFRYIATAHHLNDSIESYIFNSTKGTGLKGLTGMKYSSTLGNLNILRPLIHNSRSEILSYAESNNIRWREDSSNQSSKYSRNKIRNDVIPILRSINPNLEESFLRTFQRLSYANSFIEKELSNLYSKYSKASTDHIEIDLGTITDIDLKKLFLVDITRRYGFNYLIFDQIFDSLGNKGSRFMSDKWEMNIDSFKLIIFQRNTFDKYRTITRTLEKRTLCNQIENNKVFSLEYDENRKINFEKINRAKLDYKDTSSIYIDLDKVSLLLLFRSPIPGDRFQPLGMSHSKKLSDFYIDSKVPRHERMRSIVMVDSNDHIIGVLGLRPSEICKIDSNTTNIIKIWISP